MRVLGIDPGYAIVGYGVVDYAGLKFTPVRFGAITTPAGMPFNDRLVEIFNDMQTIIEATHPEAVSIEKLYFNSNQKTAIAVAEARGVILLAARLAGIPIYEYTPLQAKLSIVGYGRAEKAQVMEMIRQLLNLKAVPRPDDTADALGLAICHAHTAHSLLSKI